MPRPHSPGAFSERRVLRDPRLDMEEVQSLVARELGERGYGEPAAFAIRLALEEAIVNAFRHGNKNDPGKQVRFHCHIDEAEARFEVEDEGPGFDPCAVPDPTEDENIEIPSGRGIMLIKAYMSEVEFLPPGNRLRMIFRRPAAKTG